MAQKFKLKFKLYRDTGQWEDQWFLVPKREVAVRISNGEVLPYRFEADPQFWRLVNTEEEFRQFMTLWIKWDGTIRPG